MTDRLFERAVTDWLESGSDRTPPAAIDAVLLAIKTTPQARRGPLAPWRLLVNTRLRASIAAVAAAVVLGVALYSLTPRPDVGHPTAPPTSPSPSATIATQPSATTAGGNAPQARITVRHDSGLVFAFGSLWIGDEGGVQRIDPATNTATT